jgi:hypothetical protein
MIHLKHNLEFEPNTIHKSDILFWRLIANNRTQCWEIIRDGMQVTDYIADVTCRDCIEAYNKGV